MIPICLSTHKGLGPGWGEYGGEEWPAKSPALEGEAPSIH